MSSIGKLGVGRNTPTWPPEGEGEKEGGREAREGKGAGRTRGWASLLFPSVALNFRRPNLVPGAITRFHIYEYLFAFTATSVSVLGFCFLLTKRASSF